MKLLTVVGARPQFIKAAAVSRVIRQEFSHQLSEVLVHTGQHFDSNMSQVFFDELEIPKPHYHLEIGGGSHGAMTGRMLEAIEKVLLSEKPDCVLVYGDTNSTLAGALAAAKLHIPVAHVEAGLRSFNKKMPEEINRVLTDHVSSILFCPTETAENNLKKEGITSGVYNVGDVMFDVALFYREKAVAKSHILTELEIKPKEFTLATCHRAENTDHPDRLKEILSALHEIAGFVPVILPLHPRTKKSVADLGLQGFLEKVRVTEPLSYLDMVALEQSARMIITDSGGVQKEAFFYEVPCITIRDETEWVETVESGWNTLVGASRDRILNAFTNSSKKTTRAGTPYGKGKASSEVIRTLIGGK